MVMRGRWGDAMAGEGGAALPCLLRFTCEEGGRVRTIERGDGWL